MRRRTRAGPFVRPGRDLRANWPGATITIVALVVATPAAAQEPVRFADGDPGSFSPNTLVSSLHIDAATMKSVTNTGEFVAALREHLQVEASMPLDEPLSVIPRWNVHSSRSGNPYTIQSARLGFALEGGSAVSSDLASAVRASHEAETLSDWEEEEAWAWFREALENVLAEPSTMMQLAPRARNEAGHVELRIAAVHSAQYGEDAWALQDSFERDHIEVTPGARFGSSMLADWVEPEGLTYDIQVLFFELEPATETKTAPTAEGSPQADLPSIELSPEALDQFVGSYEIQPGVFLEVWREGDALVSAPRDEPTDRVKLTPFSQTGFWTEVEDERMTLTFNLDSSGTVESATLARAGFTITMPRIR